MLCTTRSGRSRPSSPLLPALLASLVLAACGGGDDDTPPVLVAGADTVTLAAGQSAPLLANDTIGGAAATTANVSFSVVTTPLPAGVTLSAGTVSVAAEAMPGTTTITYRICDLQLASNCANGELRLTVPAPPIVAGADTFSLSGGNSADVLANDTLAGVPATAATVAVTATTALPANVTLSAAGLLAVATGATPAVTDIGYSICQKAVPANCANATIKLTVIAAGALGGRALDASTGLGIAGITVRAAGVSTTTDAGGNFSLAGVAAQERVSVVFDGPTHAETARIARVRVDATTDVQVRMLKIGTTASVDVAAGGAVTLAGSSARLVLPANGVQRADGSVPAGNMTVHLTAIDPAVDSAVMPGDFTTMLDGNAVPIESYGALNIKLLDAAGAALNLRAGQTATLRIPVATRSPNVPATMPLFFYDTAAGRWVQEGTATLGGGGAYYEGTVTHFSTWNADMVYDTVRVTSCVADASGAPVAGAFVQSDGVDYSGTSSTLSGADGKFVLAIRKGSQATVVGLAGGRLTNTLRYGPYDSDRTLSDCLVIGQTGAGVTMKLTWGASPRDLDSHLYAPNGSHVYYSEKGALLALPFANLDVDDISSYGPEVVTLTKLMVGTYKYSVHNYSGQSDGTIGASGARVELNIPGRNVELFVPPTTGETASTNWWNLFELDVAADCSITVRRVGSFSSSQPAGGNGQPVYCTP